MVDGRAGCSKICIVPACCCFRRVTLMTLQRLPSLEASFLFRMKVFSSWRSLLLGSTCSNHSQSQSLSPGSTNSPALPNCPRKGSTAGRMWQASWPTLAKQARSMRCGGGRKMRPSCIIWRQSRAVVQQQRLLSSTWMLSSSSDSLPPRFTRCTPGSTRQNTQSKRLILGICGVRNRAIGASRSRFFSHRESTSALSYFSSRLPYCRRSYARLDRLFPGGSSRIPVSSISSRMAVILAKCRKCPEKASSSLSQAPPGKTREFSKDICGLRTSMRNLSASAGASPRERMMLAERRSGLTLSMCVWCVWLVYNRMQVKNATQLLDKTTRNRIFSSRYWKEECFALNAESFIDKAVALKCIGGLYGGAKKPTKFLCLLFKMLQMGLSEDIALVYLGEKEYKYLNALALLYLRLTLKPPRLFHVLEPFYVDNRKLRLRNTLGRYELTYVDQFVDELLTSEICLGLTLPFVPRRLALELQGVLDPRTSLIEEELNGEVQAIKEEAGEEDVE